MRTILRAVAATPLIVLLIFPSFQLARTVQQSPTFTIPSNLDVGDLLALEVTNDIESLVAGGVKMQKLKDRDVYVTPVAKSGALDVSFSYAKPVVSRMHFELKEPEHPTANYFRTRIPVRDPAAEAALVAQEIEAARIAALSPKEAQRRQWVLAWAAKNPKPMKPAPVALTARAWPAKLDPKTEVPADLACWREPNYRLLEQEDLARKRNSVGRHFRLAAVSAAGPGEVIYTGNHAETGRTVVVYHGGTIYTRYTNLQESLVSKGARIKTGQEVGLMAAGTMMAPTKLIWEARMGAGAGFVSLNPKMLLDLSSRLCGSK